MDFQQQRLSSYFPFSLIFILFEKIVSGFIIYNLFRILNESDSWIQPLLFGGFYLFERLTIFAFSLQKVTFEKCQSILILSFYLLRLEFILYAFFTPNTSFTDINRSTFLFIHSGLIHVASTPLFIIMFHQMLSLPTLPNSYWPEDEREIIRVMLPALLSIISLIITLKSIMYGIFIEHEWSSFFPKRKSVQTAMLECFKASFHYLNYFTLLYVSFKEIDEFATVFFSFHTVAAPAFIWYLKHFIQNSNEMSSTIPAVFLYIKELIHLNIDPRSFSQNFYYRAISYYSLHTFDVMNIFSIIYKSFLFSVYSLAHAKVPEHEMPTNTIDQQLLKIWTIISLIWMVFRSNSYRIHPKVIQITNRKELREYLELDRAEAAQKQKQRIKGQQQSVNTRLDRLSLVILNNDIPSISIESYLECMFMRFQGAQIRMQQENNNIFFRKKEFLYPRMKNMEVRLFLQDRYLNILCKFIEANSKQFLNSIRTFSTTDQEEGKKILLIIPTLVKVNSLVSLVNQYPITLPIITNYNQNFVQVSKSVILQFLVFDQYVKSSMSFSPNQVFFDLYEFNKEMK